jgi:hypothetical protein
LWPFRYRLEEKYDEAGCLDLTRDNEDHYLLAYPETDEPYDGYPVESITTTTTDSPNDELATVIKTADGLLFTTTPRPAPAGGDGLSTDDDDDDDELPTVTTTPASGLGEEETDFGTTDATDGCYDLVIYNRFFCL